MHLFKLAFSRVCACVCVCVPKCSIMMICCERVKYSSRYKLFRGSELAVFVRTKRRKMSRNVVTTFTTVWILFFGIRERIALVRITWRCLINVNEWMRCTQIPQNDEHHAQMRAHSAIREEKKKKKRRNKISECVWEWMRNAPAISISILKC